MQLCHVQCSSVECSAVQCGAVQNNAVQCSAVQHSAVQCSAVQCSAVQCSVVQCSAVWWTVILPPNYSPDCHWCPHKEPEKHWNTAHCVSSLTQNSITHYKQRLQQDIKITLTLLQKMLNPPKNSNSTQKFRIRKTTQPLKSVLIIAHVPMPSDIALSTQHLSLIQFTTSISMYIVYCILQFSV